MSEDVLVAKYALFTLFICSLHRHWNRRPLGVGDQLRLREPPMTEDEVPWSAQPSPADYSDFSIISIIFELSGAIVFMASV